MVDADQIEVGGCRRAMRDAAARTVDCGNEARRVELPHERRYLSASAIVASPKPRRVCHLK